MLMSDDASLSVTGVSHFTASSRVTQIVPDTHEFTNPVTTANKFDFTDARSLPQNLLVATETGEKPIA